MMGLSGNLIVNAGQSRAARDAALSKVLTQTFSQAFQKMVKKLPRSWEGTGEDLRLRAMRKGLYPYHCNAWGAAVRACVKRGELLPTGEYRQMKVVSSHARMTPLYIKG